MLQSLRVLSGKARLRRPPRTIASPSVQSSGHLVAVLQHCSVGLFNTGVINPNVLREEEAFCSDTIWFL